PNMCHKFASSLRGNYQSIEDMDAKDLLSWAKKFDRAKGNNRAVEIIDFMANCATQISTELKTIKGKFKNRGIPDISGIRKHRDIADLLLSITNNDNYIGYDSVLAKMKQIENIHVYRAELLHEMQTALRAHASAGRETLEETAWHTRSRTKYIGRRDYQRVISRTLLIKGLEYDHAVVLGADQLDIKNLYVALTRGSTSLTILSKSRFLLPEPF
ncbi:MAG: hypothetical protein K8J31_05190, partial [Anaerolineae bacterium]|nr:hypothetical protein [Anaerolineae bacterium]